MLYLMLKINRRIFINETVEMTVRKIKRKTVRWVLTIVWGLTSAASYLVHRLEILSDCFTRPGESNKCQYFRHFKGNRRGGQRQLAWRMHKPSIDDPVVG